MEAKFIFIFFLLYAHISQCLAQRMNSINICWMNEWSFQQDSCSLKSGTVPSIFCKEPSMSGTEWQSLVFDGWFTIHCICKREIFFLGIGNSHAHLVQFTSCIISCVLPSSVKVNHAKGRTINWYQPDSTLETNTSFPAPSLLVCDSLNLVGLFHIWSFLVLRTRRL